MPRARAPGLARPTTPSLRVLPSPAAPAAQPGCACGGGCPRCRPLPQTRPDDTPEREARQAAAAGGLPAAPEARIHTDDAAAAAAAALRARAYTVGRDIYFAKGQLQPGTAAGRQLLAHELAHVVQQRSTGPMLARDSASDTAGVMALGTRAGSGLQFWPTQVQRTRIGPTQDGQQDPQRGLSVIIAATLTPRQLAQRLLPLWNGADPFVPEGSSLPVDSAPVGADELARALLAWNQRWLQLRSPDTGPVMSGWAGGLRLPLPVRVADDGTATVNRDHVRALASGFDAAWEPLLDQSASAVAAPADPAAELAAFTAEFADPDTRGRALRVRASTNAIRARPLVEAVLREAGSDAFTVALGFMNGAVNHQLAAIASQRDGAAAIAAVRTVLQQPPAAPSVQQQHDLARADTMFAALAGIVARAPPAVGRAVGITGSGGTAFPATDLPDWGTPEQTAFMRQVYSAHVASAVRRGRVFNADVPAAQLTTVEGGGQLHVDAAPHLADLLAQARADLATAQAAGTALAVACTGIGVSSSYRSASTELSIWRRLFPDYYAATADARAEAEGGEHGSAAVAIMVGHYSGRKAAPGFGNHTLAVAVDFSTTQGGTALGPSTAQERAWRASWLHAWLVANAATYHFNPIATEAWHWEYRP